MALQGNFVNQEQSAMGTNPVGYNIRVEAR